uniref:Uncharacterized protein n=1 Tax=Knipowitschia caucasica TaxID=637954 RepID=A0AAV2M7R1_KNICA
MQRCGLFRDTLTNRGRHNGHNSLLERPVVHHGQLPAPRTRVRLYVRALSLSRLGEAISRFHLPSSTLSPLLLLLTSAEL